MNKVFSLLLVASAVMSMSMQARAEDRSGGEASTTSAVPADQPAAAGEPALSGTGSINVQRMKIKGRIMIATGWPVLGGTWLVMLITGSAMYVYPCEGGEDYCDRLEKKEAWLMAPLFGPIVTATMEMNDNGADLWWAWLEIFSSMIQFGGLAVAIAGHIIASRAKAAEKKAEPGRITFRVAPMLHVSGGVVGLSAAFNM